MLRSIFAFSVIFFCSRLLGQDLYTYFYENLADLNDSNAILHKLKLKKYDAVFFGENHESKGTSRYEDALIQTLSRGEDFDVFIEFPVSYYSDFKKIEMGADTLKNTFINCAGGNKELSILLRKLYLYNKSGAISQKLKIYPIDMISFEEISLQEMLSFFRKKRKSKCIKTGYTYLKNIRKLHVQHEDTVLLRYLKYRDYFYKMEDEHRRYFNEEFSEVKMYLNGIYTYSLAKSEDSVYKIRSVSREEFMLDNIMQATKDYDIKRFVSVNGAFHVSNSIQNWEGIAEWKSLASMFRERNPDKKVCSIYFYNREADNFIHEYFPQEEKIFLENVKADKACLIRLDGQNTPFKDLSKSFQYVVIW